jgi:hypothetical protein
MYNRIIEIPQGVGRLIVESCKALSKRFWRSAPACEIFKKIAMAAKAKSSIVTTPIKA